MKTSTIVLSATAVIALAALISNKPTIKTAQAAEPVPAVVQVTQPVQVASVPTVKADFQPFLLDDITSPQTEEQTAQAAPAVAAPEAVAPAASTEVVSLPQTGPVPYRPPVEDAAPAKPEQAATTVQPKVEVPQPAPQAPKQKQKPKRIAQAQHSQGDELLGRVEGRFIVDNNGNPIGKCNATRHEFGFGREVCVPDAGFTMF